MRLSTPRKRCSRLMRQQRFSKRGTLAREVGGSAAEVFGENYLCFKRYRQRGFDRFLDSHSFSCEDYHNSQISKKRFVKNVTRGNVLDTESFSNTKARLLATSRAASYRLLASLSVKATLTIGKATCITTCTVKRPPKAPTETSFSFEDSCRNSGARPPGQT